MFNSNIQKGGALLDDTRRLVEAWSDDLSPAENLARILDENVLGKRSRMRAEDVLRRILKPRFVDPGVHVIAALRGLLTKPPSFREACYYEASRDDRLLAVFVEEHLFESFQAGRTTVTIEETTDWLEVLADKGDAPLWSDSVRIKVARGLLAALRDFAVLEGGANKRFATPRMTPSGFSYVAFREYEQGRSSRALVDSHIWRRWLLDDSRIGDLFLQAERLGVLRFSRVGSSVRIDWAVTRLEEVTGAAA